MGRNNLLQFKRFIVVEKESGKPMSFSGDQFCYCTTSHWEDTHFPVKSYSYGYAQKLIEKSLRYRRRRNFALTEYEVMPVKQ